MSVAHESPCVLVAQDGDGIGLPSGPFTPARHRTLEDGLRDDVAAQIGYALGAIEQLYTFADRYRDAGELAGGPRLVSIGYLALTRGAPPVPGSLAAWRDVYEMLPWEDWREGRPAMLESTIRPGLGSWIAEAATPQVAASRRSRVAAAFGLGAEWRPERALERYELLYECELVAEARRDAWARADHAARALGAEAKPPALGEADATGVRLRLDHRRILATALGRLRSKLEPGPIVSELMGQSFTLLALQRVIEGLIGLRVHKQNFRRLITAAGLVEETGRLASPTGGRPAALFRFRREALAREADWGLHLPTIRTGL